MALKGSINRGLQRLRNKFRLVVVNDVTFEEKLSFVLSRWNVISFFSLLIVLIALIVLSLVVYTPLRDYIIGHSEIETRNLATNNALQIEELERQLRMKERYIGGIQLVMKGEIEQDSLEKIIATSQDYSELDFSISEEDSLLRAKVEAQEKYNLNFSEETEQGEIAELSDLFFFPPVSGRITDGFDLNKDHLGIDVVAAEGTAIKSVLPGTVIFTGWTNSDGHVVHVQHANNLVSIYKHNSVILKKTGDLLDAGATVSIIGNTGELSDGPHLHFELWHLGKPLDPENFIIFN
ncbi:MAG: M23 family metallopeptidase [Flavobacteriales bacterium]|nr:M23 family metallopeptidase [Flavobacteriales bacterium]